MFRLTDYQQPEPMLADHLPWFALVNPTTLLNKDGSYSTVIRYRGPDIDSTTEHARCWACASSSTTCSCGWATVGAFTLRPGDRRPTPTPPATSTGRPRR